MRRILVMAAACAALTAPATAGAHAPGDFGALGATGAGILQSGGLTHLMQAGGTTGGHVVQEGDRLYMGMYGVGIRIFDIADPAAPRELGTWKPADSVIGPRAVADAPPDAAVFDGRHIAVLNGTSRTARQLPPGSARTDNTYFLDTTDPAEAKLLWTFQGPHDGESHNGDIVDARRWWLPSGGRNVTEGDKTIKNGLRIYDLNPLLQSPAGAPAELFRGDPVELWRDSPHRNERPVGAPFTHTHDITVYPDFEVGGVKRDIALLAEGGAYADNTGDTGSMFVIDITNPESPVVLLRWLHEKGAGHHPIRYHHEAQFLDGDPRVVLVTDEDLHNGCKAGGVTALRLSEDLTSATELSEWFIGDDGSTFPVCSVHVFSSHGNLVFFGSYNAGVQAVDYSKPEDPRKVAHNVQLGADTWGADYRRGWYVYAGDFGARGLDAFRYGGPRPDYAVLTPTFEGNKKATTIRTTVGNRGELGAPATVVEFRDGDQVIGRRSVPALAPGATADVSLPWDTKSVRGTRSITVLVDPANRFDEVEEINNRSSATYRR